MSTTIAIAPAAPEPAKLPAALLDALKRPAASAHIVITDNGQTFVLQQVR
jgi:hypothetical protein